MKPDYGGDDDLDLLTRVVAEFPEVNGLVQVAKGIEATVGYPIDSPEAIEEAVEAGGIEVHGRKLGLEYVKPHLRGDLFPVTDRESLITNLMAAWRQATGRAPVPKGTDFGWAGMSQEFTIGQPSKGGTPPDDAWPGLTSRPEDDTTGEREAG